MERFCSIVMTKGLTRCARKLLTYDKTIKVVSKLSCFVPIEPTRWPYQFQVQVVAFLKNNHFLCKKKKALAFNWDRCYHLVLGLWLIIILCLHSPSRVENSDEVCPRPVCCTGWETKTEEVAEVFEACLTQVISQK